MSEQEKSPPELQDEAWRERMGLGGKAMTWCALAQKNGVRAAWIWARGIHDREEWQMANPRDSMLIFSAAFAGEHAARKKAERIAKAERALRKARDRYDENSGVFEWEAVEKARADLIAAGGEP